MRNLLTAIAAALTVAGCASGFGEADTPETRAFRTVGAYAYVSVPARNYVAYDGADRARLDRLCRFDQAVHDAIVTASQARQAGADDLTAYFAAVSRAFS